MSILVVGSVAIDSVKTPFGRREEALGGSGTFFSVAASFFNQVNLIAVVGRDFPKKHIKMFHGRNIGTSGLRVASGRTFRWKGSYDYDLNTVHTIYTHLNVFKDFDPQVPDCLRDSKFVFLANIDPALQGRVLRQIRKPKFVACDSMNYWLDHKKEEFKRNLPMIDTLILNDAEARQLTEESNLIKASRQIISMGPQAVVIKKGEHGVVYFSKNSHFVAPAYLLETVYDPTGAGDSFAGGFIGFLSRANRINEYNIRKAVIYGSILASFAVEDFSVDGLLRISLKDIKKRYAEFRKMTCF